MSNHDGGGGPKRNSSSTSGWVLREATPSAPCCCSSCRQLSAMPTRSTRRCWIAVVTVLGTLLIIAISSTGDSSDTQAPAAVGAWHHARGLKEGSYGQFSPLQDSTNTYGGWGGNWVLMPPPEAATAVAAGAGVPRNSGLVGSRSAAAAGNGRATNAAAAAPTRGAAAVPTGAAATSATARGGGASRSAGSMAGLDSDGFSAGVTAGASQGGGPEQVVSRSGTLRPADLVRGLGLGGSTTVIAGTAADGSKGWFDPLVGAFVTPAAAMRAATGAAAASVSAAAAAGKNGTSALPAAGKKQPPPRRSSVNTTVLDDDAPQQVVNVPANAFEAGYCVPRRQFLVTNVTARACNPGSNLTTWDGEPVCARLDCTFRGAGTNTMQDASGCRTVVERARPICPTGCQVIEQRVFNATLNRTQVFNKCSCMAGNQRCPARWFGCVCYPRPSVTNNTQAYVVCSDSQGECPRKCNLARPGSLAPLCPIQMDPLLSSNATGGPTYPLFGWNLAAQGGRSAAAAQLAVGRRLRRLLQWGTGWGQQQQP